MDASAVTPPHSLWRRRVIDPIVVLMTQGVTAEKITQTLAVGTVCSLFPFLGTTALLNFAVGLRLRLNQPILQTLNQLLTPVHLVMIVVYVRTGEWIWGAADERFTVGEMLRVFREQSFGEFINRFGVAGWHAFSAWVVTGPLVFALIYFPVRPVLLRLARRTAVRPVA